MSALLSALLVTATPPVKPVRPTPPVKVTCDDMVVENRSQAARCEGHVKAIREAMTLSCDRSLAHYDAEGNITDLTCYGHVRVVEKNRVATSDHGVYDDRKRTVELTGHAVLVQGEDRLVGEPIVFYVDDNRVVALHAKLRGNAKDLSQHGRDGGVTRDGG